jgi:hypothetical protein
MVVFLPPTNSIWTLFKTGIVPFGGIFGPKFHRKSMTGSNMKPSYSAFITVPQQVKFAAGDCQLTPRKSFLEFQVCGSSAIETTFQFAAKLTLNEQIITDVAMEFWTDFCRNDQCNRFGLKRFFLEHFKSYVVVFVLLKSVGN